MSTRGRGGRQRRTRRPAVQSAPPAIEAPSLKKKREQLRGTAICFTKWDYTEADVLGLKTSWPKYAKYICFGKERSQEGRPHLQGYMSCIKTIAYSTLHEYPGLAEAHFINASQTVAPETSAIRNRWYCSKGSMSKDEWLRYRSNGDRAGDDPRTHPDFGRDADFWESGELSEAISPGKSKALKEYIGHLRSGLHNFEILDPERDVDDEMAMTFIRHGPALGRLQSAMARPRNASDGFPMIFWLWGSTGLHKTKATYDFARKYVGTEFDAKNIATLGSMASREGQIWFDDFQGQPCVVFPEIRSNIINFGLLLQILDRYPLPVNVKSARQQWNPEVIFLCSPQHPREVFGYVGESLSQLYRRIFESGGRCWDLQQHRSDWEHVYGDLLPRGSASTLADPRLRPRYVRDQSTDAIIEVNNGSTKTTSWYLQQIERPWAYDPVPLVTNGTSGTSGRGGGGTSSVLPATLAISVSDDASTTRGLGYALSTQRDQESLRDFVQRYGVIDDTDPNTNGLDVVNEEDLGLMEPVLSDNDED
ncbi:MAG: Rep [Cressdnaviricota sp.]|nr:MAG: Rep [Cressdnaviricota sp.]